MTADLAIAGPVTASYPAPGVLLAGVCLGSSLALPALLSAALGDDPAGWTAAAAHADGLLVALESWAGDIPPHVVVVGFKALSHRGLQGRPVGLIAVGDDLAQAVRNLAWARRAVRCRGGYVVGNGLCADASDVGLVDGGVELADVTLSSSLALLGQRVGALARVRHTLRAV